MAIIRPLESTDSHIELNYLFSQLTLGKCKSVDFKALLASSTICLVVVDGDKIIGFGALVPYYLPTVGEVGKIEEIIIDEKYRGQGLGKQLVQKLIETAQQKKLLKLQLTSSPKRIAARNLYQALGFEMKETNVFVRDSLK